MTYKFYTIVGNGLKVNVRKFRRLIHTFVDVAGKKLVGVWGGGGGFLACSLNRVNRTSPAAPAGPY